MSESEIKAWRVKERKKRKALKQKENRKAKKKRFKDIQSMLTMLSKVEGAPPKKNQGIESAKASKGVTGKNRLNKGTDQKDAVNPTQDDGKLKVNGMSPVLIKSSDEDDASHELVPSSVVPAMFRCKIAYSHHKDLEAEVLSEEYEFNLFDVIIDNIEKIEGCPVATYVFGRRFIPVYASDEDSSIAENDASVIDGSYLNGQLLG